MAGPSQFASLVIVLDVDFEGMATLPPKGDAVLIVHANAVSAGAVALKGFEAVACRHEQVVQPGRRVEQFELSLDSPPQRLRDPPGGTGVPLPEQVGRCLVPELRDTRPTERLRPA
jgi:hypothetical protein